MCVRGSRFRAVLDSVASEAPCTATDFRPQILSSRILERLRHLCGHRRLGTRCLSNFPLNTDAVLYAVNDCECLQGCLVVAVSSTIAILGSPASSGVTYDLDTTEHCSGVYCEIVTDTDPVTAIHGSSCFEVDITLLISANRRVFKSAYEHRPNWPAGMYIWGLE